MCVFKLKLFPIQDSSWSFSGTPYICIPIVVQTIMLTHGEYEPPWWPPIGHHWVSQSRGHTDCDNWDIVRGLSHRSILMIQWLMFTARGHKKLVRFKVDLYSAPFVLGGSSYAPSNLFLSASSWYAPSFCVIAFRSECHSCNLDSQGGKI